MELGGSGWPQAEVAKEGGVRRVPQGPHPCWGHSHAGGHTDAGGLGAAGPVGV